MLCETHVSTMVRICIVLVSDDIMDFSHWEDWAEAHTTGMCSWIHSDIKYEKGYGDWLLVNQWVSWLSTHLNPCLHNPNLTPYPPHISMSGSVILGLRIPKFKSPDIVYSLVSYTLFARFNSQSCCEDRNGRGEPYMPSLAPRRKSEVKMKNMFEGTSSISEETQ